MKTVTYNIPVNDADEGDSVTVHRLTISGTRKERRREFGKYVAVAYGVKNPRGLARQMGFRDLL